MERRKFTTISIPTPLYEKIKERIEGTCFTSPSDYATYVLREILSSTVTEEGEPFTKKDEERVKKRLNALGYLG